MSGRTNYNAATHALMRAMVADGTGEHDEALEAIDEAWRAMVAWRVDINEKRRALKADEKIVA